MPIYNVQETLDLAVQSILHQSFTDFELIIIDDASSDNSLKLAKTYRDERIKIIENTTNIGLAESLNKGIKESLGEYIARMDADDISDLSRLGKQVDYLDRNPSIDVLGTSALLIDKNGNEFGIKEKPSNLTKFYSYFANPVIHPSVMFKRSIFDKGQSYPKWKRGQDYGFFASLLKQKHVIKNIQEPLIKYRTSPRSKFELGKGRFAARRLLLLNKKLPLNDYELLRLYGNEYSFLNRIEDILCLIAQKIIIQVNKKLNYFS